MQSIIDRFLRFLPLIVTKCGKSKLTFTTMFKMNHNKISIVIFIIIIIGGLYNISHFLLYKYIPFVDHPSHLLRANIICNYNNPEYEYYKYFSLSLLPKPNILTDYLTAALARFMPIDYAGKVMWSIIIFLFPMSVWFFIRQISPSNEIWSLFTLSLVWSSFVGWGNQNFCFGSCLVFIFWGLLAKWDGHFKIQTVLLLMGFMTILYLCHILAFLLGGLGVFSHIFISGFRSIRNWLIHSLIVMPGLIMLFILFAFSWYFRLGPFLPIRYDSTPISSNISAGYKFEAITASITPLGFPYSYNLFWKIVCLLLFSFVIYRVILSMKKKIYFPSLIVLISLIVFIFLPNPFFFFNPDRRILWIAVITSLILFPKVRLKYSILIFFICIISHIIINFNVAKWFKDVEKQLTHTEKIFSTFPKRLRLAYIGDQHFAWGYLHRAFEYYHIRYGGIGMHHIIGWENSVQYKNKRSPTSAIYEFGPKYLVSWLNDYDGILVVAQPHYPKARQVIQVLIQKNYRLFSQLPFALLLHPDYYANHFLHPKNNY